MEQLREQPAALIVQLLRGTKTEFCKLRAHREVVEMKLDGIDPKDPFERTRLRAELRSLGEQMANVQIEQLEHRMALLREQLPEDKKAIAPAQSDFDRAHQRYIEAGRDQETAAAALHIAQTKVSCAESNLSFYERTIEELKQKLASKGSPERSAGEIASELSSLEKRLGQLKMISLVGLTAS